MKFGLHEAAVAALAALVIYAIYLESKDTLSDDMLWMVGWILVAADLFLSLTPGGDSNDALRLYDKLVHFVGYAALTFVFLSAGVWRPGRGFGRWHGAAAPTVFAIVAFGALVEMLQAVMGRDAQLLDAVANSIGVIVGVVLWRAVATNRLRSDPS